MNKEIRRHTKMRELHVTFAIFASGDARPGGLPLIARKRTSPARQYGTQLVHCSHSNLTCVRVHYVEVPAVVRLSRFSTRQRAKMALTAHCDCSSSLCCSLQDHALGVSKGEPRLSLGYILVLFYDIRNCRKK